MPQERILVAEDEPNVRAMCTLILERAGYAVVTVSDGAQAVERVRQEVFDLLLTDIKMPRMTGMEACHQIRAFNAELPIVIMTGFGTLESAIDAMNLGVSDFVLKPFRPLDLQNTLARTLARKRLERENARLKALMPIFDLSQTLTHTPDLETMPRQVVHLAREETQADSATLLLTDKDGQWRLHAAEGLTEAAQMLISQQVEQGSIGLVAQQAKPFIVEGQEADAARLEATYGDPQVFSAVSLPLLYQQRILGVLNVAKTNARASAPQAAVTPFSQIDVDFLTLLANQAAVALENARLFRELQQAYVRLAEMDHLKSEFIAIAAHELRTPLAVILAYAALLEEETVGQTQELLARVVQSGMQLKAVIDEMVSLRRLDTGETEVTLTAVALATALAVPLGELRPLAESKSQTVKVELPDDLPAVYADMQVLQLILNNLLSNAIKFTPERGYIQVTARVEHGRIVIAIHDTGIGIPQEELGRIFERFYQVEDSLRREHGGIGLGLAIAREMAELLDGRLWAESQPDQGSTFYLSLAQASTA